MGDGLERRITWLWSTPRSGAELILGLLAHPLRPEPASGLGFGPPPSRASVAPSVIPIDEPCIGGHLAPWPGEAVAVGDRWVPGTLLHLNEGRPPYLLSRAAEAAWREPLRDLIIARIGWQAKRAIAHVRDLGPESPIVVKEVTGTHAADRVAGLMAGTGSIAIVRDPRDVVASHLLEPEGFYGGTALTDASERAAVVGHTARIWSMCVDVLAGVPASDGARTRLQLRYEDLLAEPAPELSRALDTIGIDRDRAAIAEAIEMSPLRASPEPGGWRSELSAAEVETVEAICGARLSDLGYEASTAPPQSAAPRG